VASICEPREDLLNSLPSSSIPLVCIKFSAASRLPLGGKLSLKATDEGRILFLLKFLNKAAKLDFLASTPFSYVKKAALLSGSAAFSPPQQ